MIEHKVIEVNSAEKLEKEMNKLTKDGWMPTTNPVVNTDTGGTTKYLIVMSKQLMPKTEK